MFTNREKFFIPFVLLFSFLLPFIFIRDWVLTLIIFAVSSFIYFFFRRISDHTMHIFLLTLLVAVSTTFIFNLILPVPQPIDTKLLLEEIKSKRVVFYPSFHPITSAVQDNSLLSRADTLFIRGKYDETISLVNSLDFDKYEVYAGLFSGGIGLAYLEFASAEKDFRQVLRLAYRMPDGKEKEEIKAKALQGLGDVDLLRGRVADAGSELLEAQRIMRSITEPLGYSELSVDLAYYYFISDLTRLARKHLNNAKRFSSQNMYPFLFFNDFLNLNAGKAMNIPEVDAQYAPYFQYLLALERVKQNRFKEGCNLLLENIDRSDDYLKAAIYFSLGEFCDKETPKCPEVYFLAAAQIDSTLECELNFFEDYLALGKLKIDTGSCEDANLYFRRAFNIAHYLGDKRAKKRAKAGMSLSFILKNSNLFK